MKREYGKQMQLWPGGQTIYVRGDGDKRLVKTDHAGHWRKASADMLRKIKIEELAKSLAEREIYCCDSCLVDELIKQSFESNSDFARAWSMDDVVNYYVDPSDWDMGHCKEYLDDNGVSTPEPNPWEMDRPALVALLNDAGIEVYDSESDDVLRQAVITNMEDETISGLADWREAVRDYAQDSPQEIYEWWRVSKTLARNLKEIGECVLDNDYGEWWGRTCTGQGYLMDGTLQQVAEHIIERCASM